MGKKARNGAIKNITHVPIKVNLGDFAVKKLYISEDKRTIVAMDVDQRTANKRMKDDFGQPV